MSIRSRGDKATWCLRRERDVYPPRSKEVQSTYTHMENNVVLEKKKKKERKIIIVALTRDPSWCKPLITRLNRPSHEILPKHQLVVLNNLYPRCQAVSIVL